VAQGTPRELIARGSGSSAFVTVRGEGCIGRISAAEFVESAQDLGSVGPGGELPEGFTRLAVRGRDGRDITVDLYRLAVEQGWTLSELRSESAKLEDVFSRLTRGTAGQPEYTGEKA
jgi:hypothetical protein